MSTEANTPAPVTEDTLNSVMEFDHIIRVLPGGAVIRDTPLSVGGTEAYFDLNVAPDGTDEFEMSPGWTLMAGYTGQHGYNGPVMHPSEFIGGGMARHILETPGYYVALEVSGRCDYDGDTGCTEDTGCDCEPAGWAVAYREAPDFSAVMIQDVYHYGDVRRVLVEPFGAVAARLKTEAHHGATRDTLAARLKYVAAALEELKDTGRSASWGWHTLTIQGG